MSETRADLEALVALNQEIAALVRAGIPLEAGLRESAESWPTQFSALAERVAARLSLGDSLVDAVRKEGRTVTPAYLAVIEAGLVSGNLPEALEDVAELGLTIQEIRRQILLAAVYPLIVCCLAYAMFVAFICFGVPMWLQTRAALFLPPNPFFQFLSTLHDAVGWWGPLIPIFLVTLLVGLSLRGMVTSSGGAWRQIASLLWIPGVRPAYRHLQRAQFARILATMIEHKLPAGRAVLLSAESTGDAGLTNAADSIVGRMAAGTSWQEAVRTAPALPPYLQWMMIVGEQQGALPDVLRQAAQAYQRRAERWLEWIRGTLPVLMVGALSGSIVTIYGLGLFIPLQQFWYDLIQIRQ